MVATTEDDNYDRIPHRPKIIKNTYSRTRHVLVKHKGGGKVKMVSKAKPTKIKTTNKKSTGRHH
jgi:hypothetical protein